MKRDYELVKQILSRFESAEPTKNPENLTFPNYSEATVAEHLDILKEAGLIVEHSRFAGRVKIIGKQRLTWAGHDALAAMNDNGIWEKAKKTIFKEVGAVPVTVLVEWLKWQMKEKLGMPST